MTNIYYPGLAEPPLDTSAGGDQATPDQWEGKPLRPGLRILPSRIIQDDSPIFTILPFTETQPIDLISSPLPIPPQPQIGRISHDVYPGEETIVAPEVITIDKWWEEPILTFRPQTKGRVVLDDLVILPILPFPETELGAEEAFQRFRLVGIRGRVPTDHLVNGELLVPEAFTVDKWDHPIVIPKQLPEFYWRAWLDDLTQFSDLFAANGLPATKMPLRVLLDNSGKARLSLADSGKTRLDIS